MTAHTYLTGAAAPLQVWHHLFVSARNVRSAYTWFVAWLVVGAGLALGVLSVIGLFLLPVVVVATAFLVTRRGATRGLPGLISGIGIPLLYIAYLNRAGPGTVCTVIRGGHSCLDEYNPWPWLYVGTLLLLVGVAAFLASRRRRDQSAPLHN